MTQEIRPLREENVVHKIQLMSRISWYKTDVSKNFRTISLTSQTAKRCRYIQISVVAPVILMERE